MTERCWAFLAADFEAAASEAAAAVGRVRQLMTDVSSTLAASRLIEGQPLREWLERRPEWTRAQEAMASQLKARAALQEAGLAPPPDALERATRAQYEFMRLGLDLRRGPA